MKALLLLHHPQHALIDFIHEINGRIKIIPFYKYVILIKKHNFLCIFYPFISLIYSFFLKVKEDILFVEGGSSLYVGAFLKMRNRRLKLIYLDSDLLFYDMVKSGKMPSFSLKFSLKMIDAVISLSEQNKEYLTKFLSAPIEICPLHPKEVRKENITRKNYGLYLGRLDFEKNIKRIIDFAIQCPYFERFIIVGYGMLKGYVEEMCKKNKKLIYLGRKDDISRYYSECKFLIHIPDTEPYGCTVLEAAICGCYPIMSKEVGATYLFDEIFIIDNPDDFDGINERIKYILNNEQKVIELLRKSIPKIPTKEQALENFRNKFEKIAEIICNQGKK
jgi:glycosyltransferase involved in cell wall biosynthesis